MRGLSMQVSVSVENTSALGRRLTVVVPAKRVQEEMNKEEAQLGRLLRLPGFRPGKVPPELVKKKIGAEAHQKAVSSILETSLFEAIEEEKLNPATQPEIINLKSDLGQELYYQAIFEVFPEIILPDFATIKVEKFTVPITEQDVEKALEKIRKQLATEENALAELDDAFAKQIGAASADREMIDQKIREFLGQWLNNAINSRLRASTVDELLKAIPLEIPKGLLDNEIAILHQQHHHEAGGAATEHCHHEGLEEQARNRVAIGLILKQVIAQEKLVLDQERFQAKVTELLKIYPIEHLREIVRELQNMVLADQAIDCVLAKATVGEKLGTVDQLLN